MKHGGVAPKWKGKAPRKPLTPERLYLEDRREALLQMDPSLRLLTGGLATKLSSHIVLLLSLCPLSMHPGTLLSLGMASNLCSRRCSL